MKTSLWTIAATALLLAGCSKEEITENVTEGVSSVATATNGNARLANPDNQPDVWFQENQGRLMLKIPPRWTHVAITATVRRLSASGSGHNNEVMEAPLERIGNSNNYRSGRDQFVFGESMYFSLLNVTLQSDSYVEEWEGEAYDLQLFLYPSGRTVVQAPKVVKWKVKWKTPVWENDVFDQMAVIIADDPAQAVSQVKLVPEPIYGNPDDPTDVFVPESVILEKTHENQNLGLSRWIGRQLLREVSRQRASLLMRSEPGTYGVDFLDEEDSREIVAKYSIEEAEDGTITTTLNDEPEIIGERIESETFGETWKMEIAVADLSEGIETAFFVLEEIDGSPAEGVEFPLELSQVDRNLKVFTYDNIIPGLNPDGGELGGTVYLRRGGVTKRQERIRAVYKQALKSDEV